MLAAAVTFAAAIVAVMLEHVVTRRRNRRDRIEAAVLELDQVLSTAVTGLSAAGGEGAMSHGTPYWAAWERSTALLSQLRVDVGRGWRRKDRKAVVDAVDDKAARLGAAFLRSAGGRPLSTAELVDFTTLDLREAVFGKGQTLEDGIDWYMANGFGTRWPRD